LNKGYDVISILNIIAMTRYGLDILFGLALTIDVEVWHVNPLCKEWVCRNDKLSRGVASRLASMAYSMYVHG
jgi:hypothetical protein